VTWHLAASSRFSRASVSAGQHVLAAGGLPARDLGGLLLLALIAAAVYLASCIPWPYGPCLACRANPRRNPGSTSKRHGRCRVCRGTGERLRVGTRILRASGYRGGRWPS
jgi:hypothetical protein